MLAHLLPYSGLDLPTDLLHTGLDWPMQSLFMNPSLQCEPQDPGLCQAFERWHGVLKPSSGRAENPSFSYPEIMRLAQVNLFHRKRAEIGSDRRESIHSLSSGSPLAAAVMVSNVASPLLDWLRQCWC